MCWHFIVDIGEQFPPSGFKSFLGASEGRHNLAFAFFLPQFFLINTNYQTDVSKPKLVGRDS